MTFDYLRPEPDVWSFPRLTDILVDFATRNGMQLDVNPLTMQKPLPTWLTGASLNAAQVRSILQDHITTLVGRYAGRIRSWEVANELLDFRGDLHDTFWRRNIGDDYVDLAFQWAHAADPKAKLYYNDFDLGGESTLGFGGPPGRRRSVQLDQGYGYAGRANRSGTLSDARVLGSSGSANRRHHRTVR